MRRAGLTLLALCIAAPGAVAATGPRRIAVIAAQSTGGPGSERLRYTARDARKIDDVLREMGGFDAEDTALLVDPDADRLMAALNEAEMRVQEAAAAGRHTLFLFYYSGHAAGTELRLGDSRLPMAELRAVLQASAADVRVAFLDACQSGAITRLKGGRRAPSFITDVAPAQDARGYVIITSSTANEASQESDDLRGSFFTHYLVSGLRGAADRSGDAVVTLDEAYAYAYNHTLARTAGTRGGTQHATYTYDLRGNGAVPLTRLEGQGALVFPEEAAGAYLVYDLDRDLVVGEMDKSAGDRRRLSVAPGRYAVKKRAPDELLLQELSVERGASRIVRDADFEAVAFEDDVTKGPAFVRASREGRRALSLSVRLGYQGFFDSPTRRALFHPSPMVGLRVEGTNLVAPHVSAHADVAAGRTNETLLVGPYQETVPVDYLALFTGVGLTYDLWLGDLLVQIGPRITGVYLRRDFRGPYAERPFQDLFTLSPGATLGAAWRFDALRIGLEGRVHYLHYATESDDQSLGFGEGYFTVGYDL